jgi:hypothetical protein
MNEGKNVEGLVKELNRIGETSPAKIKNLGEEAREEAAAANREAHAATHEPVPKPTVPQEAVAKPPALRPPPRDPELPSDFVAVAYTDAGKLQDDFAAELRQHIHGTETKNPEMQWVIEELAKAPDTPENRELLEVIRTRYPTVRDPNKKAQFAAFLYKRAAGRQITVSSALRDYAAHGENPIKIHTLKRSVLLEDPPFIDLNFTYPDPHGRYTHMFQEGLIDFVHGPGEGKRLRHLIARATGPERTPGRDFWATFWNAFYDDETGPLDVKAKTHINRPEVLGPLLMKFLGLPL